MSGNTEQLVADAMRYAISQLPGAKEILEIKAENEKLKEEIKKLEEENDTRELMVDGLVKTIQELKEENKELKLERQRDTIDEARSARDKALSQVKELKQDAGDTARYWECMMDFLGNPDGPTQEYVQEWAKDEGLSKLDTEDLLNNFGCYDVEVE